MPNIYCIDGTRELNVVETGAKVRMPSISLDAFAVVFWLKK